MNIIVGLSDILSTVGTFKTSSDRTVRIAAPNTFTTKDFAKLRRDCEILLDRIQKNPEEVQVLVKQGLSANAEKVAGIVKDLKLREEDFEKEGGGFIWIIIIAVACCLLLSGDTKKK